MGNFNKKLENIYFPSETPGIQNRASWETHMCKYAHFFHVDVRVNLCATSPSCIVFIFAIYIYIYIYSRKCRGRGWKQHAKSESASVTKNKWPGLWRNVCATQWKLFVASARISDESATTQPPPSTRTPPGSQSWCKSNSTYAGG